MLNLFRFITLPQVMAKRSRTIFSTAAVALGMALYVAISLINAATSSYFKESMSAVLGNTALIVTNGEVGFDESVASKIETLAGVKTAAPIIESKAWLINDHDKQESLTVVGVDLLQEKSVRDYKMSGKQIIGDALSFISQPDSLILTDTFAKNHQLKIGSRLDLTTANGKARFTVRGILNSAGIGTTGLASAYGGAMAIMDIDAARLAFGKSGKLDRIDIVLAPSTDITKMRNLIKAAIGPGLNVDRPDAYSDQMERMISTFQFLSSLFSALALGVGLFMIANSMAVSVAERRKEIGMLRALGVTRAGVMAVFLSEAWILGALGSFIGAFLGRTLAGWMVNDVTRSLSQQAGSVIGASDLKFTAGTVVMAVVIGSAASVIAALLPAWKSMQIEPVEAMRRKVDQVIEQRAFSLRGWVGFVLLFLAVGLSFLDTQSTWDGIPTILQMAALIGVALIGPAIVIALLRLVRTVLLKRGVFIYRLAIDNVLRNPKRTGSNTISILVGLSLVVIISSVNASFKGTISAFFDRVLHGDMIVSVTGRLQSQATPLLHESLKAQIEAVPGVLGAYELRETGLTFQGKQIILKYFGEPPASESPSEQRYRIFDTVDINQEEAGHTLFHSIAPTVMISENFAAHFRKKRGDMLELPTPAGIRSFQIIATIEDYASAVGTVLMAKENYKKFFSDELVNGFAVRIKNGFDQARVRVDVEQGLANKQKLTILLNSDIKKAITESIDSSFAYVHAVEIAALLVALLGLMNTLLISVMERSQELGVSRAVGMSRGQVISLILVEASAQGIMSALVAIVLGTGVGALWVSRNLAQSLGWKLHFHFPFELVGISLGLGLLVTLLSAVYPAYRAARMNIVTAVNG